MWNQRNFMLHIDAIVEERHQKEHYPSKKQFVQTKLEINYENYRNYLYRDVKMPAEALVKIAQTLELSLDEILDPK